MKRIGQFIAIAVMLLAPVVAGSTAYAAGTCEVGFTGPNSNNQCTKTTTYACTVTNNNTIVFEGTNIQVAASGDAGAGGNTNGGSTLSGSATNDNNQKIDVIVKNNDKASTCTATTTVPAKTTPTPTKPVPAPVGGKGAVTALPNTSGDSTAATILGLTAALGLAAVASRAAVLVIRRINA